MKFIFKLNFLLVFALIFSLQSKAQKRCESLFFTNEEIQVEKQKAQFVKDLKVQLKSKGFQLSDDGTLFDKLQNKEVGNLEVYYSEYLYEWADLEYQEIWMHNGGLSQRDVNEYINSPKQSYGRGYYVSTNPFDSMEYGPAISIFKTKGPVVTLSQANDYWDNRSQVLRLKAAGIDAFSNGKTWLAVINAKHLSRADQVNDPVFNDVRNLVKIVKFLQNAIYSKMDDVFDQSTLIGRLKLNKLTVDDVEYIYSFLQKNNSINLAELAQSTKFPALVNLNEKQASYHVDKFRLLFSNRSGHALASLLSRPDFVSAKELVSIVDKLGHKSIFEMMKFVDIQDLYSTIVGKNAEFKNLDDLFLKVEKTYSGDKLVDLKLIFNSQTFFQEGEKILGQKPAIRSDRLVMADDYSRPDDEYVQLSTKAHNQAGLNQLLSLRARMRPQVGYEVEYASLLTAAPFYRFITPDLRSRIHAFINRRDFQIVDLESSNGKKILKDYLTEITNAFFYRNPHDLAALQTTAFSDGKYVRLNPYRLTKAFVSLHPFTNGNGRLARLYYRYLMHQFPTQFADQVYHSELFLLNYDTDVFLDDASFGISHKKGMLLAAWLSTAKNKEEFIEMVKIGYQVVKSLDQDYSVFYTF